MIKEHGIKFFDELIKEVESTTYTNRRCMKRFLDNTFSRARQIIPSDSHFLRTVYGNIWFPPSGQESKYINIFYSENIIESSWNFEKIKLLNKLNSIKFDYILQTESIQNYITKLKSNNIFIVHGHNDTMKLAVDRTITQLGLTPIILHEQPNKGRTIIEKFEELSEDIGFAIVLLSADDTMQDGKHRARQNVILELGYFIAKLGRDNVVALHDTSTDVELPSDILGVIYEHYDNPYGAWRYKIVQELKQAGYNVDANALT